MIIYGFLSVPAKTCAGSLKEAIKESAARYDIPSADFLVEIKEDGTVNITEKWKVVYKKGQRITFKKEIYGEDVPLIETFVLDEDSVQVLIDGQSCLKTTDTEERPDDTFYIWDDWNGSYHIECYKRSENVTRNYEIRYRLKDAVKLVDDRYYAFSFRLASLNEPLMADSMTARIIAPAGSTVRVQEPEKYESVSQKGNVAVYSVEGIWDYAFYFADIEIDNAGIEGAVPISSEDMYVVPMDEHDEYAVESERKVRLYYIIGAFLVWICVIYFGGQINKGQRQKKIDDVTKSLEQSPTYYSDIFTKWSDRFSPLDFAFSFYFNDTVNSRFLLYTFFNYFLYTGAIKPVDDVTFQIFKQDGLSVREMRVLEFLIWKGRPGERTEEEFVDTQNLLYKLENERKDFITFEHAIQNLIRSEQETKLTEEEQQALVEDQKTALSYVDYLVSEGKKFDYMADEPYLYMLVLYWMLGYSYKADCWDEKRYREEKIKAVIDMQTALHGLCDKIYGDEDEKKNKKKRR